MYVYRKCSSILKLLLDLIINQSIIGYRQNKQVIATLLIEFLPFNDFVSKSVQNIQKTTISADPSPEMCGLSPNIKKQQQKDKKNKQKSTFIKQHNQ